MSVLLAHPDQDQGRLRKLLTPMRATLTGRVLAAHQQLPADLVADAIQVWAAKPDNDPARLYPPLERGDVATLVAGGIAIPTALRVQAAAHPDVPGDVIDRLLFAVEHDPPSDADYPLVRALVRLMDDNPHAAPYAARVSALVRPDSPALGAALPSWYVTVDGGDPAVVSFDHALAEDDTLALDRLWSALPAAARTRERAEAALLVSAGDSDVWEAVGSALSPVTETGLLALFTDAAVQPPLHAWMYRYPRLVAYAWAGVAGHWFVDPIDDVVAAMSPHDLGVVADLVLGESTALCFDEEHRWTELIDKLPVTTATLRRIPVPRLTAALASNKVTSAAKRLIAATLTSLGHGDGDVTRTRTLAFTQLLADADDITPVGVLLDAVTAAAAS